MIDSQDPACATNLTATRPLYYEQLQASEHLWGPMLNELAKDIAAVHVFQYLEEAQNLGLPPDCESYHTAKVVIYWWSPAAFGRMRLRVER